MAGFEGVMIGRASGHPGGSGPVPSRRGARGAAGIPAHAGKRSMELRWNG
ncbi:hypothetical protein FHS44_007409 [Streptosporangium saharense]|uniref:Uncharacterized protein n=1 Tax=Streptosporangium saharense TaxID=1706840 RepID=A0A7W7VSB8_9ACTN|nr:hypothetical protein [Streptosporangium saharense]